MFILYFILALGSAYAATGEDVLGPCRLAYEAQKAVLALAEREALAAPKKPVPPGRTDFFSPLRSESSRVARVLPGGKPLASINFLRLVDQNGKELREAHVVSIFVEPGFSAAKLIPFLLQEYYQATKIRKIRFAMNAQVFEMVGKAADRLKFYHYAAAAGYEFKRYRRVHDSEGAEHYEIYHLSFQR